jgi:hypothetical protein
MYTSDAFNWRFSRITRKAGLGRWHAREGRHAAVSIMSSNGVPIQEIGVSRYRIERVSEKWSFPRPAPRRLGPSLGSARIR